MSREIEGFRYLEDATFRCGAVENTVALYRNQLFAKALKLDEDERDSRAEFVLLEGGTFAMGMAEEVVRQYRELSEETEGGLDVMSPLHDVEVAPFLVARTLLTQEVWDGLGELLDLEMWDQRYTESPYLPVHGISNWWMRELAPQLGFRLPSEAEWEYAARGGSSLAFFWGETVHSAFEYAWYGHPHEGGPMGAGQKKTNAFGLYDVAGNVWELCADWWFDNHIGAPTDSAPRTGDDDPLQRVIRGGSFRSESAADLLVAFRSSAGDYYVGDDLGVRPFMSVEND